MLSSELFKQEILWKWVYGEVCLEHWGIFFLNQIHILRIVDFAAVGGSLQIAAKGTDFELASHVQIVG